MGKSFIDMETGEIMELMFWRTDQQQHQISFVEDQYDLRWNRCR